jgi:hypothetical protein
VLGRGAFRIDRGDHDALAAGAGDVTSRPLTGRGGESRATPYTRKPAPARSGGHSLAAEPRYACATCFDSLR